MHRSALVTVADSAPLRVHANSWSPCPFGCLFGLDTVEKPTDPQSCYRLRLAVLLSVA